MSDYPNPEIGTYYRLGSHWHCPIHRVKCIEGRKVYSEGDGGNTGTCLPLWQWRRKYHPLAAAREGGRKGGEK